MRIVVLGVNHRTASVDLREKLAVVDEKVEQTLRDLQSRWTDCECVLVSTCNRTELYVARPTHHAPCAADLRRFLARRSGVEAQVIKEASICREQEQAVRHLFCVGAGLDSMVLGEPQILGQLKRAYEQADRCGTVGPMLHMVFQQAIAAAKRTRRSSGIDAGRVSVASVAVDFARQIFEDFSDKTILGIGAGDMAKATLRSLLGLSPRRLWVVNRSLERAAALAGELGVSESTGGVRPWDQLDRLLVEADVVLTGTGAAQPIITASTFKPLLRRRRNRPLFIIDIAVPRDVEPSVGSFPNVYLYNIDDLRTVVGANLDQRREAVQRCEARLGQAARACLRQVQNRDVGQLIRELRDQLHDIGDDEQQRTQRKLAAIAADADEQALARLLDEHTHRVINKILHLPLSQLDHKNPDAPVGFYATALRRLFHLEQPPGTEAPASEDKEAAADSETHTQTAGDGGPSGPRPSEGQPSESTKPILREKSSSTSV